MKTTQNLIIVAFLSIILFSCKKDAYEAFEGDYTIKSNGTINYFIGDTTFVDEPGTVIIKKGDSEDEIFVYVETNFVTSIAPLGVYFKAKVEGDTYEMEARNLAINIDLGGTPLSLPFTVNASGKLSEDNKILTSEVVFTGGMTGTLTSVGTKK